MFDTRRSRSRKSIFEASIECGDAARTRSGATSYVIADLRGIGRSGGIYEGLFS
jgi:hypothetical protein